MVYFEDLLTLSRPHLHTTTPPNEIMIIYLQSWNINNKTEATATAVAVAISTTNNECKMRHHTQ